MPSTLRDKVVHDALFEGSNASNIPLFSHHMKSKAAMDDLVTKIQEIGVPVTIEELPRSTRSVVKTGDVKLHVMPTHKAVAFLGYVIAKERVPA